MWNRGQVCTGCMKRKLFTLAALFSLLLSFAVAALWVRSYFNCDMWTFPGRSVHRQTAVGLCGGVIYALVASTPESPETATDAQFKTGFHHFGYRETTRGRWLGLTSFFSGTFRHNRPNSPVDYRQVAAPIWTLFLALIVPPLMWIRRRAIRSRNSGRALRGECTRCGYDLRASPGRCPKCGTAVATPPTTGNTSSSPSPPHQSAG